jgi:hypothetical protein
MRDDLAPVALHGADPVAFVHRPPVGLHLLGESMDDVGRVELELVVEHDCTVHLERHVEAVAPSHRKSDARADAVLVLDRGQLGRGRGVRAGRAERVGDVVGVAELPEPGLSLAVGLEIRAGDPLRLPAADPGQLRSLQQAHLGGARARRT